MTQDEIERQKYLLKEVDLIEDVISRMAANSFKLKGWTITLVVVTLLLKGSKYQLLIAFLPLLAFWYLDAYFLWQERMYRKLYDWVVSTRMSTDEHLLSLNAYRFKSQVHGRIRTMFSITLVCFYGLLLLLLAAYVTRIFWCK